jgi:uncharacterized membrane protein YeaQ/YmgE (transglycosylase-associated protein family)
MLGFFWWIVIGLVAGLLARLLMPGPNPMGWVSTLILGLVGSMVGGFISSLLFGTNPGDPGFHTSGIVMSTIGALVTLSLYLWYQGRRVRGPGTLPRD